MSRKPTGDLFDNPMVRSAYKAMTPKQRESYKIKGEALYGNFDFENGTIENSIKNASEDISEQLKSGIHPSFLDESEKTIMEEVFGKEWFKKWGYKKQDLFEIVTLSKND